MARYILIKTCGRGCLRQPYHELASDGSNPRCGTRINGAQWALVRPSAGLLRRYVVCTRCVQTRAKAK